MSGSEARGPQWKLLPHDPVTFFGLESGFDRKALKRAYGKLIRQFKPEKFPEEFQRIRAAFETLDGQLRYGQVQSASDLSQSYSWQASTSTQSDRGSGNAKDKSPSKSQRPAKESVAFHDRLKSEKPSVLFAELNRSEQKTPYDYFALAILSDVVQTDQKMFFQWLLTGLKEHPKDKGLFNLLYEYFQTELPLELIPTLLLTTSKVIRDDRFYYLTESAWQQLLRSTKFPVFEETLKRCEANLKDFRINARIAFYIQTLRHAMWRANPAWLRQTLDWLEINSGHLPRQLEMDFHVLELIRGYQKTAAQFVGDDPTRRQVAATIKRYFCLDTEAADALVIEHQLTLADDAESLMRAFPASLDESEGEGASAMWMLWQWIGQEVAERNGIDPPRVAPQKFVKRVFALMVDLDETWTISRKHITMYYMLNYLPYLLFAAAPFVALFNWLGQPIVFGAAIVLAVVLLVVYHFVLIPKTIDPIFEKMVHGSIKKNYLLLWRGRFVHLIDANHVSMQDLIRALHEIVFERKHRLRAAVHLVNYVPQDIGIAFYAEAARFRV